MEKKLGSVGLCVIAAVAMLIALKPKDIVACDHVWLKATCAAPKTCSVCGMISGVPLAHSWSKATCTSPRICSVCGKISGESLGHSWSEATCTYPKRCSVCGRTVGSPLGHDWAEATETTTKTCQRCGVTVGVTKAPADETEARYVDIAAGLYHTLVLKSDGTVQATGSNRFGQCDVSTWTDIVAVFAGSSCSAGIKSDGTVVMAGFNGHGQCDISDWTDIVSVALGRDHTVGLKSDGTVVAVGLEYLGRCDVSDWRNIVSVGAGGAATMGVKADGSVVTTNDKSLDWNAISSIALDYCAQGIDMAVGLRTDGCIVIGQPYTGNSLYPEIYSKFQNIVAVDVGGENVYGLTADGRVIIANNGIVQDIGWSDVCKIAAGESHLVGLKMDGTLVVSGSNASGQCDVDKLK